MLRIISKRLLKNTSFNPRVARLFSAAQTGEINPDVETQIMEVTRNFLEGVKNAQVDKLDKETTFEDLGLDSLDAIDLIVELEESFGLDISNEDSENRIKSIRDASVVFTEYVNERNALADSE